MVGEGQCDIANDPPELSDVANSDGGHHLVSPSFRSRSQTMGSLGASRSGEHPYSAHVHHFLFSSRRPLGDGLDTRRSFVCDSKEVGMGRRPGIGLACCAQQYAFLMAASLVVVAPARSRVKFAISGIVAAAIIDVPLIISTSGRAIRTILLGSSRVGIINRSTGGTVLWETDLRGITLFLLSRVAPIALAIGLAWWAARRLGPRLLAPVPMVSLMATTLVLRLVFEENLFGYYFMAASVALVLVDVVRGSDSRDHACMDWTGRRCVQSNKCRI